MKPLIDLRRVEKTYLAKRQAIIALRNVSLQVKQGEFLAITGESGSGKSTMLRIIGALEKPTSGQVIIDGYDVSKFSDHELSKLRNEKIGFVFQSFNLQPFLSVLDNVSTPAIFAGSPLKLSRDRAKQLLDWEIRQTRYPASYLAVRCSEWQFAGQLSIALAYCWLTSRRETLILSTVGWYTIYLGK